MNLFDLPKISLLKRSLEVYDRQHQAIAKNIANANNENYEKMSTDFSSVLKSASDARLKTSNSRHIIPQNRPEEFSAKNKKTEGKVDFTEEMGNLAVNQIKFDFSARVLRRVYDGISTSIRGRL